MIKILINKKEVICNQTFTIKEEMQNTSSTILNNVYPKEWEETKDYSSNYYYPEDYSLCEIYNDDTLIFAGIVENSRNIDLNPFHPHLCSLQILGFETLLSEGQTLDYVIDNKTITEAIGTVIDNINDYGFVSRNITIPNDTTIGAYSTQEKTPYDMFNYFADISGTKWMARFINENSIAIDFKDYSSEAPSKYIDYSKEWFKNNTITNLSFNFSSRDYRNRQVVLSESVFGGQMQKETLYANGYSNSFITQYDIGNISSVLIDGIEVEFATTNEKELGIKADVYFTRYSNIITTDSVLDARQIITISYISIVDGREVVNNSEEIIRVTNSLNRKGVIARYEKRSDVYSSDELYAIGKSYLKYKGTPEITLTISNMGTSKLFEVGDVVRFNNSPLAQLNTSYLVKSLEIKYIASIEEIEYKYTLVSSFNTESAINYFDNQRSKVRGNLNEGDFVTRNIDINNSAVIIWETRTLEEVSIQGGLQSPLQYQL